MPRIPKLDVKEGTISFWVRKNKLKWNDGLVHVLLNVSNNQGSVFIVKDSDNKLKFSHVVLGLGRTDVETDVSNLSISEDHFIAVTWSLEKREVILYVDGERVDRSEILQTRV